MAILACTALGVNLPCVLYIDGMRKTRNQGAAGAASFIMFAEMKLHF